MMNNPKISVIVPVYQVEKYLKRCVRSIQNQTYTDIQIILVDDGAKDKSPIICDKFAEEDERIVVIHKKNGGLSDARNAGLKVALGQYVGFVDSDDYIDPRMYEILLRQLEEDQSDIAICDYIRVDESHTMLENKAKTSVSSKCYLREQFIDELLKYWGGHFVVAWNKLYKKEIFRNLEFPFGKQHEDEFVFHRIIGKCTKITYVNEQLYYYVQRKGSITDRGVSVKSMDYGEALIDRYYFTKKMGFIDWKNYTAAQYSYKLEEWDKLSNSDKAFRERLDELRKKSRFLIFEKNAWKEYSIGGRCYFKFSLLTPKLAKKLRKLLKTLRG